MHFKEDIVKYGLKADLGSNFAESFHYERKFSNKTFLV